MFPPSTISDAYAEMVYADNSFTAALIRQFGVGRGDMRYDEQAHNGEVCQARQRYYDIIAIYLQMRADLRASEDVSHTPPLGATQVVDRWDGSRWRQVRQRWDGERFEDL